MWAEQQKTDPNFGTSRNKAQFDYKGNEKMRDALRKGLLDLSNPNHIQMLMIYNLGRVWGL